MSRRGGARGFGGVSFPRASGDEPTNQYLWNLVDEFSPRERG